MIYYCSLGNFLKIISHLSVFFTRDNRSKLFQQLKSSTLNILSLCFCVLCHEFGAQWNIDPFYSIFNSQRTVLLCKYKWPNIVLQNRLTLEQKELCRCRLKLLTYLDRLATYEVSSYNQTNYSRLICHYQCCAFPNSLCSWSLELLMWQKYILYRSRFSCISGWLKLEIVKGQKLFCQSREQGCFSLSSVSLLPTFLILFIYFDFTF